MKKNTYLCKTKLHAMHTAKANSITIEPPPLTGGAEAVYYFHSDHLGSASWITNNTGLPVQHLLYLPFGEHFVNERSTAYDERFTFTGKERDAETGYYYHGARFNSSDLGWLSVDPMSDKYPSMSPYAYCAWNPVKLVDPEGMDWVERTVNRQKEVYYDRDVKSQEDVNKKYGVKAGVQHLADGSKVGNGQYTVYNDLQNNKDGIIIDSEGKRVNPDKTIIYGEDFRIFAGVTDNSVNAETLHKNLMFTSYTGGNNPKDYSGVDNYDYIPSNLSELFSWIHDKQYDNLGAKGVNGALFQTNTWQADLLLAASNAISIQFNPNYIDKARSAVTSVVFSFIGTHKMIADFAKKSWNKLFK